MLSCPQRFYLHLHDDSGISNGVNANNGFDTGGEMPTTRMTLDELQNSSSVAISRVEAARALDVDVRTISRAIDDGSIPSVRIGRRVLIPRLPFLALFGAAND
ncbi:helix-turn-helix domain-containing protein [Rhodococcus sp. LW-XY12]|uniref:helix-turn-helix domain-containing protein n=1 Tax=Rhodococcus sp. LW-XY12 TaxID=2856851 RepID=UPI0027D7F635|nr:helix-turn-helix domain-containing protein [Rhodococcus sp. LW-XY12]